MGDQTGEVGGDGEQTAPSTEGCAVGVSSSHNQPEQTTGMVSELPKECGACSCRRGRQQSKEVDQEAVTV